MEESILVQLNQEGCDIKGRKDGEAAVPMKFFIATDLEHHFLRPKYLLTISVHSTVLKPA